MFEKFKVLSRVELKSRQEVYTEQYCLAVKVEANLTIKMAKTIIFPAAIRYQGELAKTCADLRAIGHTYHTGTLDTVTGLVKELHDAIAALEEGVAKKDTSSVPALARYYCDKVLPAMLAVRRVVDNLEGIVADDLWPLPSKLPGNAVHQVIFGDGIRGYMVNVCIIFHISPISLNYPLQIKQIC